MNKKLFFVLGLVLVMAAMWVVFYSHWFETRSIIISSASRPVSARVGARIGMRTGAARAGATATPTFTLFFSLGDDYYELTEIKVVPLAALQTNSLAQPVWHMVGDPSSDSIKSFAYGEPIEGMVPAVAGLQPEPLEPGVIYRIFVTDGKFKGQHDFHVGTAPANTATNQPPPH